MNVPQSDALASYYFLFFFSVPDCWYIFLGIVVYQLLLFTFIRKQVRAGASVDGASRVLSLPTAFTVKRIFL